MEEDEDGEDCEHYDCFRDPDFLNKAEATYRYMDKEKEAHRGNADDTKCK